MKQLLFLTLFVAFAQFISFSQSVAEMNEGQYKYYKEIEAQMNGVFKQVQKKVTNVKEKELLLQAQAAWIKFRDLHCTSKVNVLGVMSDRPLIEYGCLAEITKERIKQLKNYFEY
jgi:uncharacterized protein YecT (DUF1311 family)